MNEDDTFDALRRLPIHALLRKWVDDNTWLPDFLESHHYTMREFLDAYANRDISKDTHDDVWIDMVIGEWKKVYAEHRARHIQQVK